ncbi:MAG: CRISPR-associated protein Cas4 [Chloroflexi bacterium]|nr:CRISPR-associated protein Cas4 [Chloroflexota bacterium]
MIDDNPWIFTASDLKQHTYCARIFYYRTCLPDVRPITYKMQASSAIHETEPKRAVRRSLDILGAAEGRRLFDVSVQSAGLRLSGQIDEVIETPHELIPVDYKLAQREGEHFKLQLTAYALLLEETYSRPVKRGFLYLIPKRKAVEVAITPRLRKNVHAALNEMWKIAAGERMPPATDWRQRCADCEFRRFCNDV